MINLIAMISPVVIGTALIAVLIQRSSLKGVSLLLTLCLGTGIGFGLTSAAIFMWLDILGRPEQAYASAEVSAATVLVLIAFYRQRQKGPSNSEKTDLNSESSTKESRWLQATFVILITISMASFLLKIFFENPHGIWDACTVWNYRARWLFRGGDNWPQAFSYQMAADRPDYPLLISGSIFRMWQMLGNDYTAIPCLVAFFFTYGSIFIIFAAIAMLRGKHQGYLAAIFMLISTQFFNVGNYQYSDVPLAFYILCTVMLYCLKDRFPEKNFQLAALGGLTASCAAWTKNEGLLFFVFVLLIHHLWPLLKKDRSAPLREILGFGIGLVFIFGTLIRFKLKFGTTNDLINTANLSKVGVYLLDKDRLLTVSIGIIKKIFIFNDSLILLLVAYLALSGFDRSAHTKQRFFFHGSLLLLMLGGYFLSFMVSPYNLQWHMGSSLRRLIVQLWPAFVFLFFNYVSGPERKPVSKMSSASF